MKRYFVAYRLTGESTEVLQERLSVVVDALRKAGIDAYCNFFDAAIAENVTVKEVLDKAFGQIDERDGLFVLVASSDKSEGQLLETGYALGKNKHIIAAVQTDAKAYASDLADQVIRWRDLNDLKIQLERLSV